MNHDELAKYFGIKPFELAEVLSTHSIEMLINIWHELNSQKPKRGGNTQCVMCLNCEGCHHCYRCYNCINCKNCLFCDNISNKSLMLFNVVELTRPQWLKINKKLKHYIIESEKDEC